MIAELHGLTLIDFFLIELNVRYTILAAEFFPRRTQARDWCGRAAVPSLHHTRSPESPPTHSIEVL